MLLKYHHYCCLCQSLVCICNKHMSQIGFTRTLRILSAMEKARTSIAINSFDLYLLRFQCLLQCYLWELMWKCYPFTKIQIVSNWEEGSHKVNEEAGEIAYSLDSFGLGLHSGHKIRTCHKFSHQKKEEESNELPTWEWRHFILVTVGYVRL